MEITKDYFKNWVVSISCRIAQLIEQDYFTPTYKSERYDEMNSHGKHFCPLWIESLYIDECDIEIRLVETTKVITICWESILFEIPLNTVKDADELTHTALTCISYIANEFVYNDDTEDILRGIIEYK